MAQGDFVKVAQVSAISPGDLTTVEVGGEQILLVNVDGDIHACDDICSHAYASLSEGDLAGAEIECHFAGILRTARNSISVYYAHERARETKS